MSTTMTTITVSSHECTFRPTTAGTILKEPKLKLFRLRKSRTEVTRRAPTLAALSLNFGESPNSIRGFLKKLFEKMIYLYLFQTINTFSVHFWCNKLKNKSSRTQNLTEQNNKLHLLNFRSINVI